MWLMWLPRDLQDLLIPVEQRPRKGFEIRESKILGWDLSRFSIQLQHAMAQRGTKE